jgi:ATP-dependent helicase/nuclease subunit A
VSWTPNPEQQAAIEAKGRVFVSAGAGTGKTAVLVERFVRAVCDEGMDVDSILVITYTKRAAGELRARIFAAVVGPTWPGSSTVPGSRRSTVSATGS